MAKYILVSDSRSDVGSQISELLMLNTSVEMVFCCQSYDETIDFLSSTAFDMIFVRVDEIGLNGILIAKQLRGLQPNCKVVMMAARECFAITAFEEKADGFLLLPHNQDMYQAVSGQLRGILEN